MKLMWLLTLRILNLQLQGPVVLEVLFNGHQDE